MRRTICVFCSSSDRVDSRYFDLAREMGSEIGKRGYTLVYGGAGIGLMGSVARAAKEQDAEVIGVLPEDMNARGITFDRADRICTDVTGSLLNHELFYDSKPSVIVC